MTKLPFIRALNTPAKVLSAGLFSLVFTVTACSRAPEPPQQPPELPPASAPAISTNAPVTAPQPDWTGKWTGPEGTWLEIKSLDGAFEVAIQNLDGVRRFAGTLKDGGIAFTRDGVEHIIRAGRGPDTGMKWLADKTDCLVVMTGEGYCRG